MDFSKHKVFKGLGLDYVDKRVKTCIHHPILHYITLFLCNVFGNFFKSSNMIFLRIYIYSTFISSIIEIGKNRGFIFFIQIIQTETFE